MKVAYLGIDRCAVFLCAADTRSFDRATPHWIRRREFCVRNHAVSR